MQQSNTYIIIFTVIMTVFFGTLLSLTRMTLEPRQDKEEEIDTKKKILGAVVDVSNLDSDQILSIYNEKMKSIVINYNNEVMEIDSKGNAIVAEEINMLPKGNRKYVNHLKKLDDLGVTSAIVGKAIYTGEIDLSQATKIYSNGD